MSIYERFPNTECQVCSKRFYKRPRQLKRDKTHCCSQVCQSVLRTERMKGVGNHQFGLKGELNDSFKKDWRVSDLGYLLVKCLAHPLRRHDGFVLAHRLVIEESLLCEDPGSEHLVTVDGQQVLSPEIVVHHLDGNRLNNSRDNLDILTLGDHTSLHSKDLVIERNVDGTFSTVRPSVEGKLRRAHPLDAGQDIYSSEDLVIYPRTRQLVSTEVKVAVLPGKVGLLWSRSGLSVKHGVEVGAGCIDSGYTGEVKVVLYNHGDVPFLIKKGDSIAQLLTMVIDLSEYDRGKIASGSARGDEGFGSTTGRE